MNEFNINLIAIILLLIAIIIIRELIIYQKYNRVTKNSLHSTSKNITFITYVSKFLKKLIIFNGLAEKYDKYSSKENKILKSGMDIISLKLILATTASLLYILISIIICAKISPTIIILLCLISIATPNIFIYRKYNHERVLKKEYLNLFIELKKYIFSGKTYDESVAELIRKKEGQIKKELLILQNDRKVGLKINESIYKAYERTRIEALKEISFIISLEQDGISNETIFTNVEKVANRELNNQKILEELSDKNKRISLLINIVPIISVLYFIIKYVNGLSKIGIINNILLILVIILIYLSYLMINQYLIKPRLYKKNYLRDISYYFECLNINIKEKNNMKIAMENTSNRINNNFSEYITEKIKKVNMGISIDVVLEQMSKEVKDEEVKKMFSLLSKYKEDSKVDDNIEELINNINNKILKSDKNYAYRCPYKIAINCTAAITLIGIIIILIAK